MKLHSQRGRTREYRDLDTQKDFFSVSQIRATMLDPYQGVPAAALEAARQRGTLLHTRFWKVLAARGGLCEHPAMIDLYAGQCRAMDEWAEKNQVVPVRLEEPGCNLTYGYAGTPDALVQHGPQQIVVLIDLKTGARTATDGTQLLLYRRMEGYTDARRMIDLYVVADGSYKETEQKADPRAWAAALSALNLLTWRASL